MPRSVAPAASAQQRDNASAVAFARVGGQANAHSHTDYSAASASCSAAAAYHLGAPLKSEPLDATAMNDCQNEDAAGRSSWRTGSAGRAPDLTIDDLRRIVDESRGGISDNSVSDIFAKAKKQVKVNGHLNK